MVNVALLGIPHDENSSYIRGPAEAPPLIRRDLVSDAYSLWTETGIDLGVPGRLVDHGDVNFQDGVDSWDLIEREVGRALSAGNPLICLGGDHAITYPILRGVRPRHPKLTIVHIDAHCDIYDAYLGNRRSHASPFARIMEERLADRLIQIGIRTNNDEHRAQAERFGVEVIEAAKCSDLCRDLRRLDISTPVYISMDIDGLDPAFAPGVSHREPGGLSTRQVLDLIQSIEQPVVAADIVEYNPRCDLSNMTALVATKLLKEIAGMMVKTHRDPSSLTRVVS